MERFKLKSESFKEVRKKTITTGSPIMLMIGHYNSAPGDPNVDFIMIPAILGIIAFALYLGIKRKKEQYDSYLLTFDNGEIIREQFNTPTINLAYNDVSKITKQANGSFIIKGSSSINVIKVPEQVEEPEKLEKLLNNISPLVVKWKESLLERFRPFAVFFTLALMLGIYVSTNKIVIAFCGAILVPTLIYGVYEIRTSKNIDNKSKGITASLIIVIFSIICALYVKLSAH